MMDFFPREVFLKLSISMLVGLATFIASLRSLPFPEELLDTDLVKYSFSVLFHQESPRRNECVFGAASLTHESPGISVAAPQVNVPTA